MLRRPPTALELRPEDREELQAAKKEAKAMAMASASSTDRSGSAASVKPSARERIGLSPASTSQGRG